MPRRYGAGSVYPLPSGRWAGQWSGGKDASGRRIRGTVTADTEAAAWKAMADARGRSSSTPRRRGGVTVAAYLARWLDEVVKPTRRERTYWGHRSIVEQHLVPAFGDMTLVSLDRRTVQAWVNRQQCAPLTTRHRLDCLRAALTRAVRWGLVESNAAKEIDLPPATRRTVRAPSPEAARELLAAVEGRWFAPHVAVALYTGLRQGELLGLRWEDVDLAGRSLTVHRALARLPGPHGMRYVLDAPKSTRSRRTVPLAAPAIEAMRSLRLEQMAHPERPNPHGLVFVRPDGRPVDGTALTHEFQAALAHAGLARMTWHQLRHGYVSMSIAAGVPLVIISQLAGHAGISITSDVYGHLTQQSKREAIDMLEAYIG